jgi:hypothetical protein
MEPNLARSNSFSTPGFVSRAGFFPAAPRRPAQVFGKAGGS